ncbi:hypothetical protein, partial [Endozoicomonas sp. ONNA1]|uniref:hypothetical protein n=1 Tax=Endozoicomonas sp. ONNA1 TaxID=2828740 RepID=UPI0021479D24
MSAMTNAEAAISILSGLNAKVAIANATKGYAESAGDDFSVKEYKSAVDLYSAMSALKELSVAKSLPGVNLLQLSSLLAEMSKDIENGKISDNVIQDTLGLVVTVLAVSSTGPIAVAAAVTGVALGAYSLVRSEGTTHIADTISNALDDAFNSEITVDPSSQTTSPNDPALIISNDPNITITDEPLQSTDINLSIETDNATGVKVITITDENGKASIVTVQPKEPLD